ncbi:hypothetical protein [Marinobacter sp. OP 3.4]|uniref:hypothetical protein n=1 Tax=Marinobacter sp. OP 3.4 TaxID=3076501 RepID=UPI002E221B9A
MNPLEKQFHIQQARLQTRKPAKDGIAAFRGRQYRAPAFSARPEWDQDFYNIPTAQRRKLLRMAQNCQDREAERLERYAREAAKRFYEQEKAA